MNNQAALGIHDVSVQYRSNQKESDSKVDEDLRRLYWKIRDQSENEEIIQKIEKFDYIYYNEVNMFFLYVF